MATTTEPGAPLGTKGRRYAEQVLDESFFGDQVPWTGVADGYDLSLHFADPQDASGALTNEINYPGYVRARLPRDRLSWRRDGNTVTNRIEARFALCQSGPKQKAPWWAITPSGQAYPAYVGQFETPLAIEPGIRPVVDVGMIEARES